MTEWQTYQRIGSLEARPWTYADQHQRRVDMAMGEARVVSVSDADTETVFKEPAVGMVARNPNNPADQWYIAPDYFAKNYALSPQSKP